MNNDLKDIKKRIFEDDKIYELLEKMECTSIKSKANRFEAKLPDKFGSNNPRSVQVFISENLHCVVWSRSISNIDIFGLVSHLVFDCEDDDLVRKNLYIAKKWICENLDFTEYLQGYTPEPEVEDPLKWLKSIKKQRPKQLREIEENQVFEESLLNQYVINPLADYKKEGISYNTQVEFNVGFDLVTERIVFPIRNKLGDIVSVKARTIDPLYKEKGIYKFIYLYNFNKMIELYNWDKALFHILEKKEILIFEAEKSCWLATQFKHPNCVAISGDNLSEYQVQMIKKLGIEIKIIIALDKDKSVEDFKKQGKKFGNIRNVFAMWDSKNFLSKELKMSPTDMGEETFEILYKNSFTHKIV